MLLFSKNTARRVVCCQFFRSSDVYISITHVALPLLMLAHVRNQATSWQRLMHAKRVIILKLLFLSSIIVFIINN